MVSASKGPAVSYVNRSKEGSITTKERKKERKNLIGINREDRVHKGLDG